MGKHLNRRHPETGELYTALRAQACAMRVEHTPIQQIAYALGVSRSCVHRWVLNMPEHDIASAKNGGVRIYPPGSRQFVNKLQRSGYSREQRLAMALELAETIAGGNTTPTGGAPPRVLDRTQWR